MKAIPFCSLLIFSLLFICTPSRAQRSTPTEVRIDNLYSGEAVQSFDLRPRTTEGSLYFREEKAPAAIQLKNGRVMNGVSVKYNLEANVLEIYTDKGAFEMPGSAVQEFTLEEPSTGSEPAKRYRFVERNVFQGNEALEKTRFVYYLWEGTPSLLTGYEIEMLKPNYNPALDAGSLNYKAVKHQRYYLYDGNRVYEIPKGRNKAAKLFQNYLEGAKSFIKSQNIDLDEEEDLIQLFQAMQ